MRMEIRIFSTYTDSFSTDKNLNSEYFHAKIAYTYKWFNIKWET